MEFVLLGKKINLSEGRKNYMKILTYYKAMAAQAEKDFKQEYDSVFGMVFLNSTYAEKFAKTYGSDDYMDKIVQRYVVKTRQYLANYGVYNLSDTVIWNEGIVAEDRSVSRLQYAFNEFFDDCLFSSDEVKDDVIVPRIKSKFSGSYFPNCLYNDIMSLCDFVLNYLDDNKITEIQFVYKKDSSEAEAIYKNLLDSNIPASEQEGLAYSLIELDPRSKLYYEHIFCKLPQAKYEIAAIAQFLSIDLSDLIEKEIQRDFDLKSISCEEDALKMMDDLKLSMEKFCVTSSSRKTELKKILHDFDIKARTYDGVLYDTRDLCTKAAKDDKMLYELHGDTASISKESCSQFLAEIIHMHCTAAVKNKHLQLLNDRIAIIDKEYMENLVTAINSADEVECNRILYSIEQYDAPKETKEPYLECVNKRLQSVWESEDFERFTEMFLNTRVSNPLQIEENKKVVNETGRTQYVRDRFTVAFTSLNPTDVESAAQYAVAKESGMIASIINHGKKDVYDYLSLGGKVMHPDVLEAKEAVKAKKSTGFLSTFVFGKNKTKQQTTDAQAYVGTKFCSACGAKIDDASKFCSGCGNKL